MAICNTLANAGAPTRAMRSSQLLAYQSQARNICTEQNAKSIDKSLFLIN
jgi:hypothetical protein